MVAPRIDFYLNQAFDTDTANEAYRSLLKIILATQEYIVDGEPDPCAVDIVMTFDCNIACSSSYTEAILKLEEMIESKVGRCNWYNRKLRASFVDIKLSLGIVDPTGIPFANLLILFTNKLCNVHKSCFYFE